MPEQIKMTDKQQLHKKVMAIFEEDFGHINFESGFLKCGHCGDVLTSTLKPQSFANHLFTISGFVSMHIECEEGGRSPWNKS